MFYVLEISGDSWYNTRLEVSNTRRDPMKIAFHTLGCKVNQYESEAIAAAFEQQGYTVVDEREFADVYVINTCTVTAVADKKSRQYIRRMKKVDTRQRGGGDGLLRSDQPGGSVGGRRCGYRGGHQ